MHVYESLCIYFIYYMYDLHVLPVTSRFDFDCDPAHSLTAIAILLCHGTYPTGTDTDRRAEMQRMRPHDATTLHSLPRVSTVRPKQLQTLQHVGVLHRSSPLPTLCRASTIDHSDTPSIDHDHCDVHASTHGISCHRALVCAEIHLFYKNSQYIGNPSCTPNHVTYRCRPHHPSSQHLRVS